MSDERQNRPILSADKIARQKSVVCHAKIARFLSANKIKRFCWPRQSMFYLRRFCRLTFRISDNKFCLCCYGDCLQRKINIYFSYLLCLLLFSFVRCRKKVMQVLFCDLHSAVVLADNVRSSRKKYRQCVMVHRFCRPNLSGNSTTPTKVSRLCRSSDITLIPSLSENTLFNASDH